jgi:hypothetical protein
MAKHSFRSAVVLVLLLGTVALAVPYVSGAIDAWLFSEGADASRPKWNTQRPAPDSPKPLSATPDLLPPGQASYESADQADLDAAPFAFDFREEPQIPRGEVRRTEHLEPQPPADIKRLQRELQALGAAYLTVERDGDRFECRTLFPLAPESSYQKAFSALGTTPEAAMEQVLAEVRSWKRAAAPDPRNDRR